MNSKIFIANWKSNKISQDAVSFLETIGKRRGEVNFDDKLVVIAPPFPLLSIVKEEIQKNNLPFKISSQDVSMFDEGAFTGEVNAKLVKEFGEYSIIGHSERRENLKETDEVLFLKVDKALGVGLTPIYCVQNESQNVPSGVDLVAYEPPTAIGTGNPDDPQHIGEVFSKIKGKYPEVRVLYGGSVKPENMQAFINIPNLSGFLVGGASLDADSFMSLLSKW